MTHIGVSARRVVERFGPELCLIPLVYVAVMTVGGLSRPSVTLVASGAPLWFLAPAWALLAWAVVGRRPVLGIVSVALVATQLALVLPAATANEVPRWAQSDPATTLLVANVYYRNTQRAEVARAVSVADADTVILNEVVPAQLEELRALGVMDRYPTVLYTEGTPFGDLLMTRLPARNGEIPMLGGALVPRMDVAVGKAAVRIHAVHAHAPTNNRNRHIWRHNLDGLATAVLQRGSRPEVYAGDFNSAMWHGPFRRLLDAGLDDSHDLLGEGLSGSWSARLPAVGTVGPVMRIDHALVTDGVHPRSILEVDIPGSDHRGFVVDLVVRQPR